MRDKVGILEYVNNLSFREINRLKKALKEQGDIEQHTVEVLSDNIKYNTLYGSYPQNLCQVSRSLKEKQTLNSKEQNKLRQKFYK